MKKLFISLILIVPFSIFSQSIPGYLGKKMVIGYEAQLFPAFRTPNSNDIPVGFNEPDYKPSLNYQHHLNFSYIYSKRSSIGVNLNYQSTYAFIGGSFDSPTLFNKVNAVGINLTYKNSIQHIAPIGVSIEPKIGLILVNPDDFLLVSDGSFTNFDSLLISGKTGVMFNLGIGYAVNRVIADQFVFSFGFDVNLAFPGFGLFILENYSSFSIDDGDVESNQTVLLERAKSRIAIRNFLNFRIGIGYLL